MRKSDQHLRAGKEKNKTYIYIYVHIHTHKCARAHTHNVMSVCVYVYLCELCKNISQAIHAGGEINLFQKVNFDDIVRYIAQVSH